MSRTSFQVARLYDFSSNNPTTSSSVDFGMSVLNASVAIQAFHVQNSGEVAAIREVQSRIAGISGSTVDVEATLRFDSDGIGIVDVLVIAEIES